MSEEPTGTDALRENLITRVTVGDALTRTARRYPDRPAVVDGDRRWTWTDLEQRANRVGNALLADGYRRGDRLALMAGNCAEFLVVHYSCAKIGVVLVPVNLGWRSGEIAYVLGHSAARGMVVAAGLLTAAAEPLEESPGATDVIVFGDGPAGPVAGRDVRRLDELLASGAPEPPEVLVEDRDPVQCRYTSGTTSKPKGVLGSHLACHVNSLTLAIEWRFTEHDRIACMMPMFHTGQLNLFCTPAVAVGACMVILPGFDAGGLLDTIESESVTVLFGLPMMYRAVLQHPEVSEREVGSLRLAVYGMAPMPDEDLRRAIDVLGCDFSLMFGQTEMGPVTTIFRPEHQLTHTGAVGTPTVNTEVAVMDTAGRLLGTGESGEIVYRGPQTMNGYLDDPDATATAFAHGWFHSGDVGHFDDDGVLWFDDRYKDVIKTGGENVASLEVERALYAADARVQEVAVVGLPHERWSEAITAVVVPVAGADLDPEELRTALRDHLDGYKIPKAVLVLDELPKTSTGKIQKNVLREKHAGYFA
ncbi:Long-chain-fatty-acid--CoA ligase [Pseudonocardia sp. Ae168_Ps1]|uniref:AMP-binding protein n=1 Tax=unclassified Pseudonocardia TaxID=2619320 RepID=UPI00094B5B3D|nr:MULTISPECIES: AMP-binding protein [unclassified Pseudonocardia]OLL71066.1 Long-chain-fatty-acid--CoA ligase [Pseudonocardia sp. Ae168_Ps1]OLL77384.1 Long-chain-fatty-acid--CoA ligase [Pseudonocardia sp. Ae150A_Ps1]OLL88504.1 Long-chain-fatty-acid--CoA ligase [Pseudonocardia sp. Ae263_Ps1]OLL91473.1 Long-chain-fatty-acid--CoA ligase [Pseudonocardia sp. Ae356_Ps1]